MCFMVCAPSGSFILCPLQLRIREPNQGSYKCGGLCNESYSSWSSIAKCTPSQLVFAKDMILRTTMEANAELARQLNGEKLLSVRTMRERTKSRVAHNYKKGDWVLILSRHLDPKLQLHHGPFKVLSYEQSSGTLYIQRKHCVEPINIRNVRPCCGPKKRKSQLHW